MRTHAQSCGTNEDISRSQTNQVKGDRMAIQYCFSCSLLFCVFLSTFMLLVTAVPDSSRRVSIKINEHVQPASYAGPPPSASTRTGQHSADISSLPDLNLPRRPRTAYGPAHLLSLNGRCFSENTPRYVYQFCPFQNVTQRDRVYISGALYVALG